jgi:hypothetical protein
MKRILFLFLVLTTLISCNNISKEIKSEAGTVNLQKIDSADLTNNFYDNVETVPLPLTEVLIEGEISNPGIVDFTKLAKHSVIVKEALLDDSGGNKFVGAYRYDGYSLFDILDQSIIKKSNAEEFQPIIDLYVEIENAEGQKIIFSWGEIYYPNKLHSIIIATDVSRIIPSKTKEIWTLPTESKIVAGNDLITERNISRPTKITVKSYPQSFKVEKGLSPMYSEGFTISRNNKELAKIVHLPSDLNINTYNTIFYGRGKGIHSTSPFKGVLIKDMLQEFFPCTADNLRMGLFCIVAMDGYRMTVSYSELMNRNDQQEFLLIKTSENEDGGLFRLFPGSDFFSDRAVKSLAEIHF